MSFLKNLLKPRDTTAALSIFLVWIFLGIVCLGIEEHIQPMRCKFCSVPIAESAVHAWGELGAVWGIVAFIAAGLVATVYRRDYTLLFFATCLSLAGIIAQALKHLVGRVRPNSLDGATHFYGPLAWFRVDPSIRIDSMPSGHTAAAFAMATALTIRWPRFRLIWYALAVGVGISRILTNSHYLSDVIFGALLGTLVSLSVSKYKTFIEKALMSLSPNFAERFRLTISQIWIVAICCLALFSQSHWIETEIFEESMSAVALLLTAVGCLGRIWSLAHIAGRKNDQLVLVGPYSMCRNPLYLFSFIAAVGIGLSTCTFTIPVLIAVGFAALYPSVIRTEEQRLSSLYGETFEAYCLSTPKFFPSFRNYQPASQLLVDMRAFGRGVLDSGWLMMGFLAVKINSELHEAGVGISFWKLW